MIKGISRQVIVVQSKDKKLFDQAIFILSDTAVKQEGVTDEDLLREANSLMKNRNSQKIGIFVPVLSGILGACICCAIWFIVSLL